MTKYLKLAASCGLILGLALTGCAEDGFSNNDDDAGARWDTGGSITPQKCKPGADADGDKIPDQVEGCDGRDS